MGDLGVVHDANKNPPWLAPRGVVCNLIQAARDSGPIQTDCSEMEGSNIG